MDRTGMGIVIIVIILVMTFYQVVILAYNMKNRHKKLTETLENINRKLEKLNFLD